MVRTRLKRSAEWLLVGAGAARAARRMRRAQTIVLAYHNVVPDGEPAWGDRSLHLPQRDFARQLELLCRTHDVVPITELLEPDTRGTRPRAVITFDDAYLGAVTAGLDELARRGLPATFFVAPAFDGGRSFCWDAVAGRSPTGLPGEVRRHAIEALQGRDDAVREWALRNGHETSDVPAHQTVAGMDDLTRTAAVPGITLASHTWSHVNLARVTGTELITELECPLVWLRARFPNVVPWLSYPYGLSSEAAALEAERAGYLGALRIDGGWLGRWAGGAQRYSLPRRNIPAGLTLRGFELRTSGLAPV